MDVIRWLIALWHSSGTRILGFAQVTVGVLATATDVMPEAWIKYLIVVSGLLTAWRGFVNARPPDDTDQAGA